MEDIFLNYANISLKDNPSHLYKIFKSIKQNFAIDLEGINDSIDTICELSQYNDAETITSIIDDRNMKHVFGGDLRCAVDAVTGGREEKYRPIIDNIEKPKALKFWKEELHKSSSFNCDLRELSKRLYGKDLCKDCFFLKCYVCHQLGFIDFLDDVVSGKEYSKIGNIDYFLYYSSLLSTHKQERIIIESNQKGPFKEKLDAKKYFIMGYKYFKEGRYGNSYHAFNEYLTSIVTFSLTEFIILNDRRKLKHCPYCNNFFIAKSINRKTRCYEQECEKAYQRDKKRKQREKEPDIYY